MRGGKAAAAGTECSGRKATPPPVGSAGGQVRPGGALEGMGGGGASSSFPLYPYLSWQKNECLVVYYYSKLIEAVQQNRIRYRYFWL